MSHYLEMKALKKSYGANTVLDNFNLDIDKNEFVALLGPSGCGKTTALRLVSGLILPDTGTITINGRDVTYLPVNKRDTTMVFQSYALFPHMTVAENIGFGLRMHKIPKDEIKEKVRQIIKTTQLDKLADRYPKQLSGGQQQRVALARALVMKPEVLLLDEPLSNLDAKLRNEMRLEIRMLHEKLGLTTLFVTHDQEEALTMADRIVFLNNGSIVQNDAPSEVFEHPKSFFVADFTAVKNFFDGEFKGNVFHTTSGLKIACEKGRAGIGLVGVRPAKIIMNPPDPGHYENVFKGVVRFSTYKGTMTENIVELAGKDIVVEVPVATCDESMLTRGNEVTLAWRASASLPLEQ